MGGAVFLSNPTRLGKSGAAGAPAAHPAEGLLAKITVWHQSAFAPDFCILNSLLSIILDIS